MVFGKPKDRMYQFRCLFWCNLCDVFGVDENEIRLTEPEDGGVASGSAKVTSRVKAVGVTAGRPHEERTERLVFDELFQLVALHLFFLLIRRLRLLSKYVTNLRFCCA